MSTSTMSLVKSFTHLKDKPHGEKALDMLQRVASLVKPIMRKRGWTLPVLSEFFPSDPSLLGEGISHNVPLSQARSKAALAAEQRQKRAVMSGNGGGQRLGGGQIITTKTPRELAAEAAGRRARDEKACGSTSQEAIERETQRAMEESVLDVPATTESQSTTTDIPSSSSQTQQPNRPAASSSSLPVKRKAPERLQSIPTTGMSNGTTEETPRVLPEAKRAKTITSGNAHIDSLSTRQWACQICTLLNDDRVVDVQGLW
ncbi:5216_t:CDS:2 [Acaulospora colombiana]|uniref:5216_t:CDS:1 n=1 Tax=Acaulospora colombiana TaxID=27376 RepID=A0ACA9KU05_9GLOM|nr:5216_t:CDS:2 [Acaulospora colombiana]